MRKEDLICLVIELITLAALIIEHAVFHLDLALELMCVCAVVTLGQFIKIMLPYAITVTYEEC